MVQVPSVAATSCNPLAPVRLLPSASTQLGVVSRWMRSGIACWRYCCLSPIDEELSMSNKMSILSIVVVL